MPLPFDRIAFIFMQYLGEHWPNNRFEVGILRLGNPDPPLVLWMYYFLNCRMATDTNLDQRVSERKTIQHSKRQNMDQDTKQYSTAKDLHKAIRV